MPTNQVRRPRFYEGQFLGAADLTTAIEYARLEDARHMLGGHTWGIAGGLELREQPSPAGGGQVDVFIQPGYAWDGFGRSIVVLSPFKIAVERLASFPFDSSKPSGYAVPVWLRYQESASGEAGLGFALCNSADQNSRIDESFQIEIGPRPAHPDRHDPVSIAGRSVDAQQVLKIFDPAAPELVDESVSYQAFPESGERSRWLVPLGHVHWTPNANPNQPGSFGALTANELQISLSSRRYVGVVAGSIESAGGLLAGGQIVSGHIRLHDRTKDYSTVQSNDLVWVEGPLRVEGDVKLFNGKLDFRDSQGLDKGVPLMIQRADAAAGGGSVQAVIGKASAGNNTFAVGPLDNAGNFAPTLTVLDNGRVGIGATNPVGRLTLQGVVQPQQGTLTVFSQTADFEYDGGTDGLFLFKDTGGKTAFMGGSVGIGTTTPAAKLDVVGDLKVSGNVNGRDMVVDGVKLDSIASTTPTTIAINTGEVQDGGTIPLIPGFSELQSFWFISPNEFAPPRFDINETGTNAQFRVECFTPGGPLFRQVQVKWYQRGHSGTPGFQAHSGVANYIVIGIK